MYKNRTFDHVTKCMHVNIPMQLKNIYLISYMLTIPTFTCINYKLDLNYLYFNTSLRVLKLNHFKFFVTRHVVLLILHQVIMSKLA